MTRRSPLKPSCLKAEQTQITQPPRPWFIFVALPWPLQPVHICLAQWCPKLSTVFPYIENSVPMSSLSLLAAPLLMQPSILLGHDSKLVILPEFCVHQHSLGSFNRLTPQPCWSELVMHSRIMFSRVPDFAICWISEGYCEPTFPTSRFLQEEVVGNYVKNLKDVERDSVHH